MGRMPEKYVRLSKKLSYALRHAREEFGIKLDAEGGTCGGASLLLGKRGHLAVGRDPNSIH